MFCVVDYNQYDDTSDAAVTTMRGIQLLPSATSCITHMAVNTMTHHQWQQSELQWAASPSVREGYWRSMMLHKIQQNNCNVLLLSQEREDDAITGP